MGYVITHGPGLLAILWMIQIQRTREKVSPWKLEMRFAGGIFCFYVLTVRTQVSEVDIPMAMVNASLMLIMMISIGSRYAKTLKG